MAAAKSVQLSKRSVTPSKTVFAVVVAAVMIVAGAISLRPLTSDVEVQRAFGALGLSQLNSTGGSIQFSSSAKNVQKLSADQTPVTGWSGWSFLREASNTSEVEGEARALVSTGLASVGYVYVNIDDGWHQCPGKQGPNVDQYGRWVVNASNYPGIGSENGIQVLAAYVHSLGLKFGIYETAGISKQAVAKNTPVLGTSYTADEIAAKTYQEQLQLRWNGRPEL